LSIYQQRLRAFNPPPAMFFVDSLESRLKRMRRRVRGFCDLAGAGGAENPQTGFVSGRWAMVTLTYAECDNWQAGDIGKFVRCVRSWLARRGHAFCYVWVAELQKRGAVHYHVLVKLPKGVTLPKPDNRGWWRFGCSKCEWVRVSARNYLAKYVSKGASDARDGRKLPRGARMCGSGGLPAAGRDWLRWLTSPAWVRAECEPIDRPRRVAGGVWLDDGVFLPTPYKIGLVDSEHGGVWVAERSVEERRAAGILKNPLVTLGGQARLREAAQRHADEQWRLSGARVEVAVGPAWARTGARALARCAVGGPDFEARAERTGERPRGVAAVVVPDAGAGAAWWAGAVVARGEWVPGVGDACGFWPCEVQG
jgi:hypothetical protein